MMYAFRPSHTGALRFGKPSDKFLSGGETKADLYEKMYSNVQLALFWSDIDLSETMGEFVGYGEVGDLWYLQFFEVRAKQSEGGGSEMEVVIQMTIDLDGVITLAYPTDNSVYDVWTHPVVVGISLGCGVTPPDVEESFPICVEADVMPPPATIIATEGVVIKSDPHFKGLDGSYFNYDGEVGKIYLILRHKKDKYQLIARFGQAYTSGVSVVNGIMRPYHKQGTFILEPVMKRHLAAEA
eukprot:scaffold3761_cov372-Prasinococcus_capsulatus_cf.AAC.27